MQSSHVRKFFMVSLSNPLGNIELVERFGDSEQVIFVVLLHH